MEIGNFILLFFVFLYLTIDIEKLVFLYFFILIFRLFCYGTVSFSLFRILVLNPVQKPFAVFVMILFSIIYLSMDHYEH